ncbi:transketolase [Cryptosporangium aurantiacum]|uniref:Transketolase n=1 Tax=Cryptosporangium aurantiacum TaxID=134849 RepID=A0A1M7JW45_9ACTN|nr:transketolase [Cryptosporangium aurantiacum]SHM57131.1 transketolase [Cryptosporangium aurantiacum]
MLVADPPLAAEYRELRARLAGLDIEAKAAELRRISLAVRRSVVEMIATAKLGHIGGDFSVTDILVTCFAGVLNLDPTRPHWEDRDRFVLSKGHCAASLYSTLAYCGFFPRSELATFMAPLSALNGHPNRVKVPGVETNSGPLGHGFPVATGAALAAKLDDKSWRTVVVLGDGEMQEGSNWEAAMTASHYELANLTAVVDRNRLQQGARTEETKSLEPFGDKWRAFGWELREVDGHDHVALLQALEPSTTGKPVAIVANTIKGKGVSFMEDRVEWHHKVPSPEQVRLALEELV